MPQKRPCWSAEAVEDEDTREPSALGGKHLARRSQPRRYARRTNSMAKEGKAYTRVWTGPHQELRTHRQFRTRTASNRTPASRARISRGTTTTASSQSWTTLQNLQQSSALPLTRWATRHPTIQRRRRTVRPVQPQDPQASLLKLHAPSTVAGSPTWQEGKQEMHPMPWSVSSRRRPQALISLSFDSKVFVLWNFGNP